MHASSFWVVLRGIPLKFIFFFFYAPAIFNVGWGGGGVGGGAYSLYPAIFNGGGAGHTLSPLSVHTSVPSARPICNTNAFCAISFEKIGVLDWNFIHRYIIKKCRSRSIEGKIHKLFSELWIFFNFEKFSALKNGFRSISFEKISVLDSIFIHRYIIIKCRSFNLG